MSDAAAWVQAIGSVVAIGAAVWIAAHQHDSQVHRERAELENMKKALFHELANRVGRCCFDFEHPWHQHLEVLDAMKVFRLRKFVPEPPVIYPAVAPKIGTLEDDEAQAVIAFYIALAAWRRDIENNADEFQQQGNEDVDEVRIRHLALRLRETLEPGHRALNTLSRYVPDAKRIEIEALKDADKRWRQLHPNAGKPIRERITIMLNSTADFARR
jgi:hypothetical protein